MIEFGFVVGELDVGATELCCNEVLGDALVARIEEVTLECGAERIPTDQRERQEENDVADQEELQRLDVGPPTPSQIVRCQPAWLGDQAAHRSEYLTVGMGQGLERLFDEMGEGKVVRRDASLAAMSAVSPGQRLGARGARGSGGGIFHAEN